MSDNLHYNRAQILLEQGRYREAEKELGIALGLDPNNAEIYNDLSICRAEAKDFDKAIELVQNAIALDPENPDYLYGYSRVLYLCNRSKEAREKIHDAIAIFPFSPEYFNLAGRIEFDESNYAQSLSYANKGLEIDPENINCLNLRSSSLVKLNRKEEAFMTIQDALYFDPENAYTHANLGWSTLEKGSAKEALVHFRNALKIEPNNNWAKSGMVEAMKGRYWVYNWFLKYNFWMNKNGRNFQWAFIIGFMVLSRIARAFYPPIFILFLTVSLLSWIMYPLSNLFLRLNKYGRYALSKEDTFVSNLVGSSLLLFLSGLLAYVAFGELWALGLTLWGFTMMIPLSSMLNPPQEKNKKILVAYTILTGLVGLAAIAALVVQLPQWEFLGAVYFIAIFVYQWVANYFVTR
ncbi:MAG TPA: tetratricopeptide repeat protein [Cytophagales bacterium]|nr:tetratricopeptide repeat protein [Cytophagales bacterium]